MQSFLRCVSLTPLQKNIIKWCGTIQLIYWKPTDLKPLLAFEKSVNRICKNCNSVDWLCYSLYRITGLKHQPHQLKLQYHQLNRRLKLIRAEKFSARAHQLNVKTYREFGKDYSIMTTLLRVPNLRIKQHQEQTVQLAIFKNTFRHLTHTNHKSEIIHDEL